MDTRLFDRPSLRIGRVWDGGDDYGHTFGGPPCHEGTQLPGMRRRAHLLYRFNLRDPALGLTLRGIRWLPIYYAFGIENGPFCYTIRSNDRIEILGQPFGDPIHPTTRAFLKTFPTRFRSRKVQIASSEYDPRDTTDFSLYAPIFGTSMLSAKEKRAIKRTIEEEQPGLIFDPTGDGPPYDSFDELVENLASLLFPHGHPSKPCPNEQCKAKGNMTFWLHLQPEEDDTGDYGRIYNAIAGGDDGRLRVLICPACRTVCVQNPCT